MIRRASKGGDALHHNPLVLVACDAGVQSQTPAEAAMAFSPEDQRPWDPSTPPESPSKDTERDNTDIAHLLDHLDPSVFAPREANPRRVDVTLDLKLCRQAVWQERAAEWDEECTTAPRYIPEWVISAEKLAPLRRRKLGIVPDLIYARGLPNVPNPDPKTFDKSKCSLLIVEVGFCRDLGCEEKREKKRTKYQPLIDLLATEWGQVVRSTWCASRLEMQAPSWSPQRRSWPQPWRNAAQESPASAKLGPPPRQPPKLTNGLMLTTSSWQNGYSNSSQTLQQIAY